ncbi:hypothetical protein SPBR_01494 [Sporothrix brasiliensis 5110]|uniref:Uncharacterized protein n=1 Tax=Sporothrix brasiliensis 5110 TaxID=1398154 RepID=A0A0C2IXQ9_9PEZI|nr:uncharacterized protein SPBR_01494 [Sporothrix brasiliensis 5110]KIH91530.1 hypothetical protein SPBR_01494 [Sporothrix brasiliensis 5110]
MDSHMDTHKKTQSSALKLTPIRMRGKRKSNRSNASNGSASSSGHPNSDSETAAATAGLTLSSSPSSPLKRSRASSPASQKTSGRASSLSTSNAARRARTKRSVPMDQRFPLEVVERIFFYSMNFNLPRASPRLGWMLSSRYTLRDLMLAAFEPQWNLTLTPKRYKRPLKKHNAARRAEARLIDPALMTAVLNSPWMKMDHLVESMQVWLQKNRNKKYLHTPIPFSEEPERDAAAEFVLNMNDFDALVREHPTEHIVSTRMLDRGSETLDDGEDEYEEGAEDEELNDDDDDDDEESSHEGEDRSPGWSSDEYSDLGCDEQAVECEQESRNQANQGHDEEDEQDVKTPETKSPGPLVSAHACFAMDQFYFLESMYVSDIFDPKPDETPSTLLASYFEDRGVGAPERPMDGIAFIGFRMTVAPALMRSPSLGKTQIPEWLLLGGGPYPASQNQTREGRKALRDRLRATFDLLSWIVFAGGKLQRNDSWELTLQGFQNLLEVDVLPNEWDTYEEGEEVVSACEHVSASPNERTIRLQYSVDTLVSGILGLFYSLGVFYRQMPHHIFESAVAMATARGVSGGLAYRKSLTYLTLQRIAFLVPANNKRSFLEIMPEYFNMKF